MKDDAPTKHPHRQTVLVMRISLSFKNDPKLTPEAGPCTAPSRCLHQPQAGAWCCLPAACPAGPLPARCLPCRRSLRCRTRLLLFGVYQCNAAAAEAHGEGTWPRVGIGMQRTLRDHLLRRSGEGAVYKLVQTHRLPQKKWQSMLKPRTQVLSAGFRGQASLWKFALNLSS